ncbi:unnamed protein product [Adineta steineri]|uniref:Serine/threonine-protein kinase PLK4 n=1 Tax=Adineta steineri TaxID=433720 RepID=A0A818S6R6_9BILA|nr:unnamed protein product [Adineta steineri]
MWLEETITHYELTRELGKGGFATVHEARKKSDGRLVACKMIDRGKLEQENVHNHPSYGNHRYLLPSSRSTSLVERLNAELTIHHQVHHCNIVELINYFTDDKYVYLILELCSGGDLERYLKEKKSLSESETQHIVKQVVNGLVYLHNHRIIHRDIKLSNLLLTDTYEVKIADFGLAKKIQLARDQNNETMCGTPNYISPEIASRTPHSYATDVWSLGILIATLLTGHPPFDTDTVHGTLKKVTHEKYELPRTFSEEAQDLVNRTLTKKAELRPNIKEIRDHPFFSKDFSHSSQSNNYKYALWGPAVDRSHDSGFVENIGQQRSTISTTSNSTSIAKGTFIPRLYSPNPISPPAQSHYKEPNYNITSASNKMFEYYPTHPSQQQLQQQQSINTAHNSSLDTSSRYNDYNPNGTMNITDHRPTSASSSVRSQDSGVPQSDPKTSIDCSAKSEASLKVLYSHDDNTPTVLPNRLPKSNSHQHLLNSQQQKQAFDINPEQIREKLQPLNTQRLKTLRQATKTLIMSIMDNGEVVLESIRPKLPKRRVFDVFRVSADGLHIITYSPNSRHGTQAGDQPPPIPREKSSYQEYHFDRLPSEYWKKYQYAHKFVTLVRSRVPKIILYTSDAKCSLMETGVDFEAIFLCGVKITIYRENVKSDDPLKIKIINNIDKSESLLEYDRITTPNVSAIEHFSPEIRQIIDKTIMCYKFCLTKDKVLEEGQKQYPSIQVFPVQFGKKHVQPDINRPNTPCTNTRTVINRFGGSSTAINEPRIISSSSFGPCTPMLSTRPEFSSDVDLRKGRNSSTSTATQSSTNILRNNIQHSNSSSTLRSNDSNPQVTYMPPSSIPITIPRSQSVQPYSDSLSSSSFSTNRPTSVSSTLTAGSLSGRPIGTNYKSLTRGPITKHSDGTFRVKFSDGSQLIICADSHDGQLLIDAQGKSHSFDRRQPHQSDAIQERLALFYQDESASVDNNISQ